MQLVLLTYIPFVATLWLGLALLRRSESRGLLFTGGALICFAFSVAFVGAANTTETNSLQTIFTQVWQLLQAGTIVFWGMALVNFIRQERLSPQLGAVLVISLFFVGSTVLLWLVLLQSVNLSLWLALGLVCIDLLLLGWAAVRLESWQTGELYAPDLRRSFIASGFAVLVVGGAIFLVMIRAAPANQQQWATTEMLFLLHIANSKPNVRFYS